MDESNLDGGRVPASSAASKPSSASQANASPEPASKSTDAAVHRAGAAARDYDELLAEYRELKQTNIGLEGEKMRLEAAVADLEDRGRKDADYIALLEAERSKYREEVDSLKRDRAGWSSQLWVLKKTYADYTQTIEAYELCCDNQAAEIKSLKEKLSELGVTIEEDDDPTIEEPGQITEPLPVIADVIEPLEQLAVCEDEPIIKDEPVVLSKPKAAREETDPSSTAKEKTKTEEEQPPLDLLDSKRLHEALEASAFFEDHEQPPSFSMPKGRLSR